MHAMYALFHGATPNSFFLIHLFIYLLIHFLRQGLSKLPRLVLNLPCLKKAKTKPNKRKNRAGGVGSSAIKDSGEQPKR